MKKFKPLTGKGDDGYTDIFLKRVPKTDLKIKLNALLDEINACLGLIRTEIKANNLLQIQKDLILLSSIIAGYTNESEITKNIEIINKLIKKHSRKIKIKKFIIFGDEYYSSVINFVRTKIRICEIMAWQIKMKIVAKYLNRLSDYLFIISILAKKID